MTDIVGVLQRLAERGITALVVSVDVEACDALSAGDRCGQRP